MEIGLVRLKKVKIMFGKFKNGEGQITLVPQLDLNGSQASQKQFIIGYPQLPQVPSQFTKVRNLVNGMVMHL